MKLKSLPTDFQVTELTQVHPSAGAFALYRLSKTSIGTPEAVNAILKQWNLPRDRISYGGMKDRHATTTQYVTIFQGPQKDLSSRSYSLNYLGQTRRRFVAQDIDGNLFSIRLRGISPGSKQGLGKRMELVQRVGLANYFDDQRFGSLGESGRFIAEPWCKGDYQSALFLALAEPNKHDRPREAQQKAILREHWGDWNRCKQLLDRSHRRSIVTYLVDHPVGFKRAISLLRSDLRSIYLSAFQSGLWNRWLSRIVEQNFAERCNYLESTVCRLAIPSLGDSLSVPGSELQTFDWLQQLRLPLPCARQHQWPQEHVGTLDAILLEYGLERHELRLKYPRDTFFSKGVRDCWLQPQDFRYNWVDDDLHSGKLALELEFQMPRGAYATMIIKLLQV